MKNSLRISLGIMLILSIFSIHSCKKEPALPGVTTQDVSEISYTTATSGGYVINDGGASIVSRGLCWNTSGTATITDSTAKGGSGSGPYRKNITNLTPGTTYYLRAYAMNSAGVGYGNEVSFKTTKIEVPVLETYPITFISQTTINTGGYITAYNGGNVTTRGVCWSTSSNPTIELNSKTSENLLNGNFFSRITELTAGTTYYIRAYATNEAGTGYGNELRFTIHLAGTTVTDIDENVYNTVTIGTQIWMVENLKATRFNDNTFINNVTNGYWQSYYPAYCWYNNDEATYKSKYGALYNFDVVAHYYDKNVCPIGWHVPSDAEWTTLTTFLGGDSVAGGKLKETGTTHWLSPNSDATNESGFTAIPGGTSNFNWGFSFIGLSGFWWSSGVGIYNMDYHSMTRSIFSHYGYVLRSSGDPRYGFSVRCLRDY